MRQRQAKRSTSTRTNPVAGVAWGCLLMMSRRQASQKPWAPKSANYVIFIYFKASKVGTIYDTCSASTNSHRPPPTHALSRVPSSAWKGRRSEKEGPSRSRLGARGTTWTANDFSGLVLHGSRVTRTRLLCGIRALHKALYKAWQAFNKDPGITPTKLFHKTIWFTSWHAVIPRVL